MNSYSTVNITGTTDLNTLSGYNNYLVNVTTGTTITLPTASSDGFNILICRGDISTAKVTIIPQSGQTLNGTLNGSYILPQRSVTNPYVFSNNWNIMSTVGSASSLVYNSTGSLLYSKIWVDSTLTSGGGVTFDISSAGFNTITSVVIGMSGSFGTTGPAVAIITSQSTSSIRVTTYVEAFTGVVILGISVLGSVSTVVFTPAVTINIIVVGT